MYSRSQLITYSYVIQTIPMLIGIKGILYLFGSGIVAQVHLSIFWSLSGKEDMFDYMYMGQIRYSGMTWPSHFLKWDQKTNFYYFFKKI